MNLRVSAVLAVLLLLLGWFVTRLFADPASIETPAESPSPGVASTPLSGARAAGDPGETALLARRTLDADKTAAPAAPVRGSLRVSVVWHDGSPAAGVGLVIRYADRSVYRQPFAEQRSDSGGVAVFADLLPVEVAVATDRIVDWKEDEVRVVAGAVTELRVQIAKGLDVHGRVLDARGAPVAGADIWLTRRRRNWLGGIVATRTEPDGRFALRSVPMGRSLGALADGYAPSKLFDLDDADLGKSPVQVELRVGEPGGSLVGRVADPQGEPVAGALLCLGAVPKRFLQRHGVSSYRETWTPLTARTGADGSYRFGAVSPGEQPLAVRAEGYAIARATVNIAAGSRTTHDIELGAGFAVSGTICSAGGEPVAKGQVRAFDRPFNEVFLQSGQYDYEDVFDCLHAIADAAGRFTIPHLPAGERLLYATDGARSRIGQTRLYVKAKLTGSEGETLTWNPVLGPGRSIRGIALFRDGVPMKNHFVNAVHDSSGKAFANNTDKKGRFQFIQLEPSAYTVSVQYWDAPKGSPPLMAKNVIPDSGELRLVAPFDSPKKEVPGVVRGILKDLAGRVSRPEALRILLQTSRGWRTYRGDKKDGSFEFDRLSPGKHKLVARCGEHIVYVGEWFEVAAGETKDLGTVVTGPGGSLRIKVRALPKDWHPGLRGMWLRAPGCFQAHSLTIAPGNELLLDNLEPGVHKLTASGSAIVRFEREVRVEAGKVNEVEVVLQPGIKSWSHVRFPADVKLGFLRQELLDRAGKPVSDYTLRHARALTSPYKSWRILAKGEYLLRVTTDVGLSGERRFRIESLDVEPPPVQLELK